MSVSVQVVGRLAADSEVRTSKNGNQFISFRVGTDEYKNGNRETAWLNVMTYDDRSVKLAQYLTKGKPIAVYGTETVSIYTDKNGVPQVSRDIRADRVEFVSVGQQNSEQGNSTQSHSQEAPKQKVQENNFPPIDCGTLRPQMQQPQVQPQFSATTSQDEDDDLPF